MSFHSPRSPSGFHRWAHCLGSGEAEEGLPDVASPWAAEGTLFHKIMAALLTDDHDYAARWLGHREVIDGHEVECNDEMVRHLHAGSYFVAAQPGRRFVEKNVSLGRWMRGEAGTTDVGLLSRRALTIIDWKYGNMPVDVRNNEQELLYAAGFWDWLEGEGFDLSNIEVVRLIIRQPRVEGGGGKPWEITPGALFRFAKWAATRHQLSLLKGQPRTPDVKTCQWCKAKLSCQEYSDFAAQQAGLKFENALTVAEPLQPRVLTPEQRSYVLTQWPLVEKWHEQLHAQALADALAGRPVPGKKAILGRAGKRAWIDEDKVIEGLHNLGLPDSKIYDKKLPSPTEMEKRLTKEEYAAIAKTHVKRGDRKPVLVNEDEEGDPVETVDSKFERLEIENNESGVS